jgi:CheY-like chemotaxis protein
VVIAGNGREGVERLVGGETFDVILCDLMMPDIPGMEVFAKVKEARPDLRDRFVFMTGGAFTPEARSFLEHVPNARIEKPFDVQSLRALIRERVAAAHQQRTSTATA